MPQFELRELVTASNPVPNPAVLLHEESDVRVLLEEALRRTDDPQASMYLLDDNVNWRSNMETKQETIDLEISPVPEERSWWAKASVAAAAIVAIVVLLFALQTDDNTTEQIATDEGAPSTTVPAITTQDALAVADAYFAANSAGDFEALRALFTPDAVFIGQFGIAGDEQLFAWNVAQGTTLSPPDCARAEIDTVRVNCSFFNLDALVQAVDGPPVPIHLNLTITPEGISEETVLFGSPNFNRVFIPFQKWLAVHHPEIVDSVEFGSWTTIEEAEENGRLRVQYAAEWAAYLEANNCTFDEGC